MKKLTLHLNPFYILGVTIRDDRQRIFELAEENSLKKDVEVCAKARADLTSPRNRLLAEISWLPGISPNRAKEKLIALEQDSKSIINDTSIPPLAHANLIAAALENIDKDMDDFELSDWITDFAVIVERCDPAHVLKDINEDRRISGFPEVREQHEIETALSERHRYYIRTIKDALNTLPAMQIAKIMTMVVDSRTNSGKEHAPLLIDGLIDNYEIEVQSYLQKEAENVRKLISAIRVNSSGGEKVIIPLIDRMDSILRKWDLVVEPIHICHKARGIDHTLSHELAQEVRSLGVELFNEYGMINQAQRITTMLKDIFEELPEVAEIINEDAKFLADIKNKAKKEEELFVPIYRACKSGIDVIELDPSQGAIEAYKLLQASPKLISSLEHNSMDKKLISKGKDEIAMAAMVCVVAFGNKTAHWRACKSILELILNLASSTEVRNKVSKNLEIVRNNAK